MDNRWKILGKHTKIDYFMSSGPGGQRRDKKKTGVRLHHLPSGLIVRVDDQRSQSQNKQAAFQILRQRLKKLHQPRKKRIPTKLPAWAKRKRIQEKKHKSEKKQLRKIPVL